jgi:hypothetical protein
MDVESVYKTPNDCRDSNECCFDERCFFFDLCVQILEELDEQHAAASQAEPVERSDAEGTGQLGPVPSADSGVQYDEQRALELGSDAQGEHQKSSQGG